MKIDQIVHDDIGDGEEDRPVHQVETGEEDGEDDSAVLVDVTGLYPEYLVPRVRWHGDGGRRRRRGRSTSGTVRTS